ncbi:hypothetical protein [Pleurocapsa sp. FMAR1]|uniref:hypothetical protein n=1 Tax=Pleurocapsa sp. FMAR1 TaxID=3040204 RepID=UPI0029C606DA|nr:hypothetical protein [Pleurocapsa sp. FMAR1]
MSDKQFWYVIKQEDGNCEVADFEQPQTNTPKQESSRQHWGSFASEQEAIAKKIGLIRAGKCKPQ